MASFELKNEETGIIYAVKVGEFVCRNTYGKNEAGVINSMESTGYTSITVAGDNIVEKLGRDAIENRTKFYFVNHPDYYIKLSTLTEINMDRKIDPTDYDDVFYYYYKIRIGLIDIYTGTTKITRFLNYVSYYKSLDPTGEYTLSDTVPNFFYNNDCNYNSRLAYNFSQQQIAEISPYYYQIQHFALGEKGFPQSYKPDQYGSNTPIYIGQSYTIKNAVPSVGYAMLYDYDNGEQISNITNYRQLSDRRCIATAAGVQGDMRQTPTMYFPQWGSNINGMKPYDFFYWLLFDTDSEDEPYPDKDPNKDPSGQSPPTTGGNPIGGNPNSEDIPAPSTPTVTPISVGSVYLYEMTEETFREFMRYLWTDTFYTAFIKLFQNPMDAIISAHIIGIAAPTVRTDYITIGNVKTTVQASVVGKNFIGANFSILQIPEFYNDSTDYLNTIVELYIPYYGTVTLNPYEVMGATISLQYRIDVLTGAFVAMVEVNKIMDGTTLNSVLYQYNGNMAYQIPLSSVDYSSFVTTAISAVGNTVTKNIKGLVDDALSLEIGYDRSGTLSSNIGYMSVKTAYVTILRPIHNLPPNFNKYFGYPYEGYVNLGSCTGYTKCRQVFINNVIGSEEETAEIKQLLESGVVL